MSTILAALGALLALGGLGLWAAVRGAPGGLWRGLALVCWLALSLGAAWAVQHLPGLPRPASAEWARGIPESAVLWGRAVPPVAIYVVLAGDPPRYYALPWTEGAEQQMAGAAREAERMGSALMLRYEPSLDDRAPMLYPAPQMAPELKPREGAAEYVAPEVRR